MIGQPYTHLVVIFREQIPEVVPFYDKETALEFADRAGAQWSETYVTEIVKGPIT